jgi:hypothetical protein
MKCPAYKLSKQQQFCECSSIEQLSIIRISGGLKTGLGQDTCKVRAEAAVKTVWEWIC